MRDFLKIMCMCEDFSRRSKGRISRLQVEHVTKERSHCTGSRVCDFNTVFEIDRLALKF